MKLVLTLFAAIVMTGCSNKLESIADEDLADTMHECRSAVDQSPGMAIRCDNITRECSRRREEGRFVC
ncbi:MAG: hypothetical protein AAF541_16420 [Pseudomonadota bacterium]